jgi:hypothetical protein
MKRMTSVLVCGAVALPVVVAGADLIEAVRPAGSTYELQVTGVAGVPADAAAVVLNLTSADTKGTGFLTAFPCGSARPNASNLNYGVGAPVANSAIVKVGTGGKVCLYTADADTELIADINGWFAASTGYRSTTPSRLLDTRGGSSTVDGTGDGEGLRHAGSVYELQVAGRAGVPANAAAVVLNLTSAEARGTGFVTAYPCGAPLPNASNLNYRVGAPVANSAIVKIGTGGKVCLLTADADTELIADVNGYFPTTGYTSMTPARLMDTRSPQSTLDGAGAGEGLRTAGSTYQLQVAGRAGVPASAAAVVLNVTSADAGGTGFMTAYPCGEARPNASNLNYGAGAPVANSAIVRVGSGGKVCLFTGDTGTELIADVNGWFPAGSGYTAMTPVRLLDTRSDPKPSDPGPSDPPPGPVVPTGADFFADFNSPGQTQSLFRHGLWRRDDVLIGETQWPADHDMACSAPDQKRIVHRSNPDESFYECKQHLMISEGDTSGYSIAFVSPDRTFNMSGAASVCWEVNLTDMGTRQWFEVGVIPVSQPDLFVESSIASAVAGRSDVVVYPRADYAVTLWSGPSAWLGKLGINGSINLANHFDAGDDVATRYPMCFEDDGAGTLTTTITNPTTGATLLSHSRAGSFPKGPTKVMFEFKYYTPTKDGAVVSTTWHLDSVGVTQ